MVNGDSYGRKVSIYCFIRFQIYYFDRSQIRKSLIERRKINNLNFMEYKILIIYSERHRINVAIYINFEAFGLELMVLKIMASNFKYGWSNELNNI